MSCKRASKRSLDEWMEMVTACRQSGMTDADWCAEHGIAPSSFYNAVTRLRKQACQIPDPIKKASTLDLTSRKQDVVRIAIEPENSPEELLPNPMDSSMYLDNSYTIEIETNGILIRMSNSVQPSLLNLLLNALRNPVCWRIFQTSMLFTLYVAERICVNLLMACARLLRISFPWSLIIHFIFSVVANATESKRF